MKDKEGRYQSSPPKELNKLYNNQGAPKKVSIEAEINSLKYQTHCCGVYTLLAELKDGKPVWKHATEDLVLQLRPSDKGDEMWVIAKFSTAGTNMQVCMRVPVNEKDAMPFGSKAGTWQEFTGKDWIAAATVKCRSTWHGWGLEKIDRSRLKYSPGSPSGAY